ncbi:MAG TPA: glycerophosphoryl diester phosphodiesterase membrane domain-containing protein [Sphingomicrobium sp.]
MAKLSISKAWDEARAIIARDGGLLMTIALALFVLPGLVSEMVTPEAPAGEFPPFGYWTILTVIALLIALVGQLAVIRLGTGSRATVGQVIGDGARRAPAYFAASLIWLLPFLLIGAGLLGIVARDPENISVPAAIGLLLLICVMLYFAMRMLMTSAVASAESANPLAIVRRSWDLTRGHALRLLGFFLVFLLGALIVIAAVSAIIGIVVELALGGTEPMTVGALLVALVTQIVSAAVSVLLMLMIARIYVQLAGDRPAEASVPHSGT